MANEKIEIAVTGDEEIPTNMKQLLKVLKIPVLSKEDMQSVRDSVERLDEITRRLDKEINTRSLDGKIDSIRVSVDAEKRNLEHFLGKFDRLVTLLDSDKERLISMDEKIGRLAEYASRDKTAELLSVIHGNLTGILSSIQSNEERLVSLFSRSLDNAEHVSNSLAEISRYVSEMHAAGSDTEKKISVLAGNINEKFDAHAQGINSRLDNAVLQIGEPIAGVNARLEDAVKNSAGIKKLGGDIKKIGAQITAIRGENVFANITEFRKLVGSYRVPKKVQPDKKRLLNTLKFIENGVVDILILKSVKNRMSMAEIKEQVRLGEGRLKIHVDKLVAVGKLKREKKGKHFVYAAAK